LILSTGGDEFGTTGDFVRDETAPGTYRELPTGTDITE
jgi:hypothetical protein